VHGHLKVKSGDDDDDDDNNNGVSDIIVWILRKCIFESHRNSAKTLMDYTPPFKSSASLKI